MRILVIGGAGYVGSHCVKLLCQEGHEVVVLDNLSAGHRAAVDHRALLVVGDISDNELLANVLDAKAFDAAMHFAALLNVGESVREPLMYYTHNVTYTVGLLEALEAANVKRLVFSSTCATYGVPSRLPITEDLPQVPINPYGHTKLCIEWAMSDSAEAWGLGGCALRYFNACGAAADGSIGENHDPEPHLIPLVLRVALGQSDDIAIFGDDYPTRDGSCIRDYIHVEDLATAHLAALQSIEPGVFKYYNVGTGRGTSVFEIVESARRVTGHPIPLTISPRRPGDPPELYADPTKIKTELAWRPRYTDIDSIIRSAWKWHSTHPRGFG